MDNSTFADRVMALNKSLNFKGELPPGIHLLNPGRENTGVAQAVECFYKKYYDENRPRHMIIGINPGRHGAGITGIPFTDTKRLKSACKIDLKLPETHEVSSVFIYDMIAAYGGPEKFYGDVYINSPLPMALVKEPAGRRLLNMNYYDVPAVQESLYPFMLDTMKQHLALGIRRDRAFVLGKKNAVLINKMNKEQHFFDELTILEHPRFIEQYRHKQREQYIRKYVDALSIPVQ